MKLIALFSGIKKETEVLFSSEEGKTLTQYRQELLIKMGRKQFEKLQDLGLSIPVSLA
ncbi:hypothetical protein HY945_05690 [Candidatus Gottesmanbacteria bacterium]|nr:hypothetical protein [Candidatus Gottesmanbacteria bacterium]